MQSDFVCSIIGNLNIYIHSYVEILAYRAEVALRNVDQGVAPQIFYLLEKVIDVFLHPVVFNWVLKNRLDWLLDELLKEVTVIVELFKPVA
jgi:hypothetical protein